MLCLSLLFQDASPTLFSGGLITVIAAAAIGFVVGGLITSIVFFAWRSRKPTPISTKGLASERVSIKHCSQCDSTYTDEELSYCLRDGTPLRVVGSMPSSDIGEETVVIDRRR